MTNINDSPNAIIIPSRGRVKVETYEFDYCDILSSICICLWTFSQNMLQWSESTGWCPSEMYHTLPGNVTLSNYIVWLCSRQTKLMDKTTTESFCGQSGQGAPRGLRWKDRSCIKGSVSESHWLCASLPEGLQASWAFLPSPCRGEAV